MKESYKFNYYYTISDKFHANEIIKYFYVQHWEGDAKWGDIKARNQKNMMLQNTQTAAN